ncbi:imm11 family protein [Haliangium ochraceum]|uniref:Immunity MXAN-0049 protein domain-containing protein n=1 Tax=Haliangium ochraceum (strain DSM 14365 / JCM 11303 / SMP-2) TaxID=502025 RepID=D0LM09_HALO1|nr:DUF1629 domain-containing protein [Haliangium ochraceum]ACY15187.1 hypothetical protein Hoch_2655 [Haliangium ochraceum DSM 14365]
MADYFLLEGHVNPGELFVREYHDPDDFDGEFCNGIRLHSPGGTTTLFYDEGIKTDYVAGVFSFPVISARFRALIAEVEQTPAEFHPVQLRCTATEEVDESYAFVNFLDIVPGLDWERSQVEAFPDAPKVIKNAGTLFLREGAFHHRHIFRIEEIATHILVSEEFRERIEGLGLTGIRYKPVAEHRELFWS